MEYQVKGARQHHGARLLAYHVKKGCRDPYPAYSTIRLYVTSLVKVKLRLGSGKGTLAVK
jgi:hypothetical protein